MRSWVDDVSCETVQSDLYFAMRFTKGIGREELMFCFTCLSPALIAKEIPCLSYQLISHRSGLFILFFVFILKSHCFLILYYLKRTARSHSLCYVAHRLGSRLPVSVGTNVFKNAFSFEIVIMQLTLWSPSLLSEDIRLICLLYDPELDFSTVN